MIRFSLFGLLVFGLTTRVAAQPLPTLRAADLSFLDEMEAAGAVYRDADGVPGDAMQILQRHGINAVRLRLWHTPPSGHDGLPEVLREAARVHALGLRLVLDLHYSDTWADPGQQTPPAAWRSLPDDALRDSVARYTARVLTALAAQGTRPDIVQIGNEITSGMLWDSGRVGGAFDTPTQWHRLAGLLTSAIAAVRQTVGDSTAVMIHIDRGGDAAGATWFFDHLRAENVPFDLIGLSYYPWWHGSLADLSRTLDTLAGRYGLPIFVAETAYPWTLSWFDNTTNIIGSTGQLQPGYPATPAGQAAFIAQVAAAVERTPGGVGVCYWAPDDVAAPGLGSPWENLALFSEHGTVLPAASALGGPAVTAVRSSQNPAVPTAAISPNPARDAVQVAYPTSSGECSRVVLYDALGRAVRQASGGCGAGVSEPTLSVAGLPSGVYTYVVFGARSGRLRQGRLMVRR